MPLSNAFNKQPRDRHMSYNRLFGGMTDIRYLLLLITSSSRPTYGRARLPGFPPHAVQRQFTGSSGWRALVEAYQFYRRAKKHCAALGNPVRNGSKILDFGCGWGRIIRFFFKDTGCENLFGVDVDSKMIEFCGREMHCGSYSVVNPEPPSEFQDASIDMVYAYSVFSHLAENTATNWIREFSRILKPGGILVATTRDKSFLDACGAARRKRRRSTHQQTMSGIFTPISRYKEDYDNGRFVYAPTGGGGVRDGSYYGEALIPEEYIEARFAKYLSLREFANTGRPPFGLPQALFVMQKR
jgi:ubiquinone/menaquinone biosynthesis C-methylase UbiE